MSDATRTEQFQVSRLIKRVLLATEARDNDGIARAIFDATPKEHLELAYLQLLRAHVSNMVADLTHELRPAALNGDARPAAKLVGKPWQDRAVFGWLDAFITTGTPGERVRLRDAGRDDLRAAIAQLEVIEEGARRKRTWYLRAARALARHKVETMGMLPAAALRRLDEILED